MPMMYLSHDGKDAKFYFALEKYALEQLDVADSYFMFWHTPPTLMVGRYQNTLKEINQAYAKKQGIDIVRRITGGGTIYTDQNGWQFSFIIKSPDKHSIEFGAFTRPILDALHALGVGGACQCGRNDLVIDGRKISGNAQYISKHGVLHHGSLLYDTDLEVLGRALCVENEKIVSKGIESARQRVTNIAEHMPNDLSNKEFSDAMLFYLTKDMPVYTLGKHDIQIVEEIRQKQFGSWEWNFGRDPKFNITKENRFEGGKLTARLYVKEGRIAGVRFYGDFFAHEGVSELERCLTGCPYNKEEIQNALEQADAQGCFYRITFEQILSCII